MKPDVISFSYVLRNQEGELLDSSSNEAPITFLTGGGSIIEGLETPLIAAPLNEKKEIIVKAERAYGLRDDKMIQTVKRSVLPVKEIKVGDQFQAGEDHHAPIVRVVAIKGDDVTLDVPLTFSEAALREGVLLDTIAREAQATTGVPDAASDPHHLRDVTRRSVSALAARCAYRVARGTHPAIAAPTATRDPR